MSLSTILSFKSGHLFILIYLHMCVILVSVNISE